MKLKGSAVRSLSLETNHGWQGEVVREYKLENTTNSEMTTLSKRPDLVVREKDVYRRVGVEVRGRASIHDLSNRNCRLCGHRRGAHASAYQMHCRCLEHPRLVAQPYGLDVGIQGSNTVAYYRYLPSTAPDQSTRFAPTITNMHASPVSMRAVLATKLQIGAVPEAKVRRRNVRRIFSICIIPRLASNSRTHHLLPHLSYSTTQSTLILFVSATFYTDRNSSRRNVRRSDCFPGSARHIQSWHQDHHTHPSAHAEELTCNPHSHPTASPTDGVYVIECAKLSAPWFRP
jgi:hypothetical protein